MSIQCTKIWKELQQLFIITFWKPYDGSLRINKIEKNNWKTVLWVIFLTKHELNTRDQGQQISCTAWPTYHGMVIRKTGPKVSSKLFNVLKIIYQNFQSNIRQEFLCGCARLHQEKSSRVVIIITYISNGPVHVFHAISLNLVYVLITAFET